MGVQGAIFCFGVMNVEKENVIIELVGVTKRYNDTVAVDNFNFYVKKGEFVSFLGPSGCGKTTTLRMIAGFEHPTEGKILLNGKDIAVGFHGGPEPRLAVRFAQPRRGVDFAQVRRTGVLSRRQGEAQPRFLRPRRGREGKGRRLI